LTGIGKGGHRRAFRDQLTSAAERDPILRSIADSFIAAHATLCQAVADLDRAVKKKAEDNPVARRLLLSLVSARSLR